MEKALRLNNESMGGSPVSVCRPARPQTSETGQLFTFNMQTRNAAIRKSLEETQQHKDSGSLIKEPKKLSPTIYQSQSSMLNTEQDAKISPEEARKPYLSGMQPCAFFFPEGAQLRTTGF